MSYVIGTPNNINITYLVPEIGLHRVRKFLFLWSTFEERTLCWGAVSAAGETHHGGQGRRRADLWLDRGTDTNHALLSLRSSHGSPFPQTFYPMPRGFCAYVCSVFEIQRPFRGVLQVLRLLYHFYLLVCLGVFVYFLYCFVLNQDHMYSAG